jgi:hypothetical protein
MGRSWLPLKDQDLRAYCQAWVATITPSPSTYGLVVGDVTSLTSSTSSYADALALVDEPSTRTRVTVADKQNKRHALMTLMRNLYKKVRAANLTNDKLEALGLPVPVIPSPIPVPAMKPTVNIVSRDENRVTVKITDPTDPTRRGKPPGVDGIAVFSFIGAVPPNTDTGWHFDSPAAGASQRRTSARPCARCAPRCSKPTSTSKSSTISPTTSSKGASAGGHQEPQPGELMVKIVYDELVNLMGPVDTQIYFVQPGPTVIMMCGPAGLGQNHDLRQAGDVPGGQGHHPMLAAVDLQRPAAVEQLKVLGEQVGVPVYTTRAKVARTGKVARGAAVSLPRCGREGEEAPARRRHPRHRRPTGDRR